MFDLDPFNSLEYEKHSHSFKLSILRFIKSGELKIYVQTRSFYCNLRWGEQPPCPDEDTQPPFPDEGEVPLLLTKTQAHKY